MSGAFDYEQEDKAIGEQLRAEARLREIRVEIVAERVSWGEIAELQGLTEYIDPSDVLLLEWAGVPEFPEDE